MISGSDVVLLFRETRQKAVKCMTLTVEESAGNLQYIAGGYHDGELYRLTFPPAWNRDFELEYLNPSGGDDPWCPADSLRPIAWISRLGEPSGTRLYVFPRRYDLWSKWASENFDTHEKRTTFFSSLKALNTT